MKKLIAMLLLWGAYVSAVQAADAASAVPVVVSSITASASASAVAATPQPSDESSWRGDVVTLRSDTRGIRSSDVTNETKYVALNGAVFDVSDDDKKTNVLTIKFRTGTLDGSNACTTKYFPCIFSSTPEHTRVAASGVPAVDVNNTYLVDKAAVEKIPHLHRGWTFGALVVPFKYQTTDKSFSGSSTLGTYVGYKFQDNSGSVTPILSAGIVPNIAVPLANGTGTVNRSGFSWAGGVIFSIDKGTGTQIGILVGQDRLGSNAAAPYVYEGKTWLSLSAGWKFI